ncbi:hypothetical protein E2C01_022362 [Portunus trituberculatus]|uniref:Uncharacterized protein n=1 Tax=Portunus trituberculatus TaxID=210409 RepID=A0A5B7E552_PORTR|nr:hypothetical protein [Portunus trituberculatus]
MMHYYFFYFDNKLCNNNKTFRCMTHVTTLPVRGIRSHVGHSCLFVVSCLSCVLSCITTNMPLPDKELFNIKYQIAKIFLHIRYKSWNFSSLSSSCFAIT